MEQSLVGPKLGLEDVWAAVDVLDKTEPVAVAGRGGELAAGTVSEGLCSAGLGDVARHL